MDWLYEVASPERGIFFRLQLYERVGISLVEVYKRVGLVVCLERFILYFYLSEYVLFPIVQENAQPSNCTRRSYWLKQLSSPIMHGKCARLRHSKLLVIRNKVRLKTNNTESKCLESSLCYNNVVTRDNIVLWVFNLPPTQTFLELPPNIASY